MSMRGSPAELQLLVQWVLTRCRMLLDTRCPLLAAYSWQQVVTAGPLLLLLLLPDVLAMLLFVAADAFSWFASDLAGRHLGQHPGCRPGSLHMLLRLLLLSPLPLPSVLTLATAGASTIPHCLCFGLRLMLSLVGCAN